MKKYLCFSFLIFGIQLSIYAQSKVVEYIPVFIESSLTSLDIPVSQDLLSSSFDFVGMSCFHEGGEQQDIFYRLKIHGNWTEWKAFRPQHEFVAPNRHAYDMPPLHSFFTDFQIRMDQILNSELTVRLFVGERGRDLPLIEQRNLGCDIPDVCYRDCWCPTCPIDATPVFTEPTHLIVHHSAGSNQSSNYQAVVEYIWDLHVNTNGWDDVGYNWLIDPNGILYEGRPDGYQGAHFSCINENTVGICMIGDYTSISPPEPQVNTLVSLLGFEATEHSIDVLGQSYHLTGDFVLDNVAGHRDSAGSEHACSTTACPGNTFYPMLGEVRDQVAALPCYNNVSDVSDALESEIKIYPNPVGDVLFIKTKELDKLELVNIYGQHLMNLKINTENDLTSFPPGLYLIVSNHQQVGKIVKE